MTQSAHPNRRDFIRTVAASTIVVGSATGLSGCEGGLFDFLHGVASGDPLQDRVMLWTRITPDAAMLDALARLEREARSDSRARDQLAEAKNVQVQWEVASDSHFRQVVARGKAHATAERDYTVKVDAAGLRAGTRYWYRFQCLGHSSPVGRTRTLPRGGVEQVKLAVFSCSNYPAGYFNVYDAAAKLSDVDAALHLGDYIYEYSKDGYASALAEQLGRVSEPAGELLTLADYRKRYAQYRQDADLQAVHAALPFIAVWDDHEIANDAWREGAENHTPPIEGDWVTRRAAALQAYHEWMPTRLPEVKRPERIFRSFDFGDLVSLHMLDTRVIGRDQQLELTSYIGASGFDGARFASDLANPARQLLGAEQAAWLGTQLARSSALWQVLGQQVLMGRMNVPAPLLLGQITVSGYAALVAKASSHPGSLTPQELAILQSPAIPYNLDAWDGYPAARETVLRTARSLDKNLVVLAGDTHNAWASDLTDGQGNAVGVEFATPSVSSPGFEAIFPNEPPLALASALQELIGPLVYADTSRRGFMLITATRDALQAQLTYVDTVTSRQYGTTQGPTLRTLPGATGRRIQIDAV
ncbi:alkaline phosphatase [Piscinibacter sp. HJYY11]|uniref:alkaline phosphatase D family protein n=1 Tax=Piscinibacter sp. HJYY11 TaxID=2801333 RepID=UPI00191D053A|nr:alkaline phosphatase D family protein [Piscinibacter sp. HJYY11]MBL0726164.1 alkaline phosphatase D family protein [Piscinibacter sp. HJYY11]